MDSENLYFIFILKKNNKVLTLNTVRFPKFEISASL